MRKFTILFAVALAVFAGTAYANFCARDVVPAATLLVPYAAVGHTGGVPDANKTTTLFSITNVSSAATIVHVTLWDVTSTPEVDFDVLLSGYDTWQINFRDLMMGRFDLFDTAATAITGERRPFEWGPDGRHANNPALWPGTLYLPQAQNRNVAPLTSCTNPPYNDLSILSAQIIDKFVEDLIPYAHAGCGTPAVLPRADKTSWTTSLGNDPIVFYATADISLACSQLFPTDAGYWTTPGDYRNVLIGDVIYFDPASQYSEAMPAVHIEADLNYAAGGTFYNRYIATAGRDYREPLGTAFAFRYADEPLAGVSSDVIVWKNYTEFVLNDDDEYEISDCGRYLYYAWDHNEHSLSRAGQVGPSGFPLTGLDPNQFPFETQSVALVATQFDIYKDLGADRGNVGWMLLVFPPSYSFSDAQYTNADVQAWAGMRFKYNIGGNKFSAGMEAATMANAHCFPTQVLPVLGTNYNYSGTGF